MKRTELVYSGVPVRLDVFLTQSGENLSRSYARRLIEEGLATVNGERKKPSYLLGENDRVVIAGPGEAQPELSGLIVFEDRALIAVSKPAGLAVHPNPPGWETNPEAAMIGEPTLVSMIYAARPEMAEGLERLGLVHRLDRDTSGLMLIAKTQEAQRTLKEGFRERLMEKTYIGAVAGIPDKRTALIDAPIGRASGFKKIKVWEYGREAVTEYAVREKGRACALLSIHPMTGRTNQIRIHLAHIGHPIIGDRLYGGPEAERMLLHSFSLVFSHPATGKETRLEVPIPDDFKRVWKKFKAR
jgi:23S rRNA pseudouridine1911/1915/1917 synthase